MNTFCIAILAVSTLALCGCGSHSSSAKAASSGSAWSIKTNTNQMTDQKTVYAVDTAKSSVTQMGLSFTPELVLGCTGPGYKNVELDIVEIPAFGNLVNNIQTVNIRFDKDKVFAWQVETLTGGHGGYSFANIANFLGKAGKSNRMLFQYPSAFGPQQVVDFDISGMNDVLKKLSCHL